MEKSSPCYVKFQNNKLHNAHCRQVQSLSRGYVRIHMLALHYIVLSDSPSPKWRYEPPKFPLKQYKMTIACNSAYVQAETLNFTFAQQAVIVHFDAGR